MKANNLPAFYTDPLSLDFTAPQPHDVYELAEFCTQYADEHANTDFTSFVVVTDALQ